MTQKTEVGNTSSETSQQVSDNLCYVSKENKQSFIYEKLLNTPDNFKAGKVKHFIDNWKAITSDKCLRHYVDMSYLFTLYRPHETNVTIRHLMNKK